MTLNELSHEIDFKNLDDNLQNYDPRDLQISVEVRSQFTFSFYHSFFLLNIWGPMLLFLDVYCIYMYSMEVDEEKIYTDNISVGVCLKFCRLDVGLQNELIVLEFKSVEELYPSPPFELTVRTIANYPRRSICMENFITSK